MTTIVNDCRDKLAEHRRNLESYIKIVDAIEKRVLDKEEETWYQILDNIEEVEMQKNVEICISN
jgi:c-di-AMP phosphodiesterase-like protein